MAAYRNINDIKIELLQILQEIIVGMTEGVYEDKYNMHISIITLLFAIDGDPRLRSDELSEAAAVPGDTKGTNDEMSIFVGSSALPSGDTLSLELEPVDPTPIPEDGPLDNAVKCEAENEIEPTQGKEEADNGKVVGRLDPPATTGTSAQPRRCKTSCWTSVRRMFRRLCCWRRETVRDPR